MKTHMCLLLINHMCGGGFYCPIFIGRSVCIIVGVSISIYGSHNDLQIFYIVKKPLSSFSATDGVCRGCDHHLYAP